MERGERGERARSGSFNHALVVFYDIRVAGWLDLPFLDEYTQLGSSSWLSILPENNRTAH